MIKTLLDADENPPENTAVIIEETVLRPTAETVSQPFPLTDNAADDGDILELPRSRAGVSSEPQPAAAAAFEPQNASEIFDAQTAGAPSHTEPIAETPPAAESLKSEPPMFSMSGTAFAPETSDETIRKSGLAYTAAIVLLGSVVFMMVLGWFADLLFGSSPWGIVGGIVLGSIIGFVQFFRTTSQILKK